MSPYLLIVWQDIEPELKGPFNTRRDRDAEARCQKLMEGDEHGIFMLDHNEDGTIEVNAYSGGFFEDIHTALATIPESLLFCHACYADEAEQLPGRVVPLSGMSDRKHRGNRICKRCAREDPLCVDVLHEYGA